MWVKGFWDGSNELKSLQVYKEWREPLNAQIPDKLKTDHLMLLIGTNPLPNYIAGRMLLKPDTRLHLVVTPEIRKTNIPNRLARLLGRDETDENLYLEVASFDPGNIFKTVYNRVKACPGSWGLHYTGGKKSMATHSYRAVERALADADRRKGVFSYLDADRLELVIDPEETEPAQFYSIKEIISLAELLGLHGQPDKVVKQVTWGDFDDTNFPLQTSKPRRTPFLPDFCQIWLETWLKNDNYYLLQEWRSKQPYYRHGKDFNFIRDEDYQSLSFPELIVTNPSTKYHSIAEISKDTGKTISHIVQWLDGSWLEHFVLKQVLAVSKICEINDYALGLESNIFQPENPEKDTFESDVIVMKGHRLFYLSVTTDTKKSMNKSKLFEAYLRAQQLGGEHAEAGMVTFFPNPARLEKELRDERHARVKVFGPNDLSSPENLQAGLISWFNTIPEKEKL